MKVARSLPAWALAGAIVFVPAIAGAQTQALGLSDAVSYALAHDPAVLSRASTAAQADNALARQKTQTYPTVNGQLQSFLQKSSNYGGGYAVVGLSQQSVTSQNTASIGTQYTINAGGLGFIQLAETQAQDDQAHADLKRAQEQVAGTVTAAFYGITQKDAIVDVDKADADYQHGLVLDAQAKERAGVAAGVDVLRAQVNEEQSKSTLVAAQADAQNARESLAQSIGAPLSVSFATPKEVPQPALPQGSVETLVGISQDSRPDISSAKLVLRNARLVRKGYTRELFPSIQIGASVGNQNSPTATVFEQNSIDQQFALTNQGRINEVPPLPPLPLSDKAIVPRGTPGYWQVQAVSTFTLPLVDYGARHTERASDDAAIASADAALASAQSQAELDVRQSYRAAQTAQSQLGFATDESRLGREAARIAQIQYQNGIIALSDVVQAEQTSVKAQSDLIAARVAYVTAVVNLRIALGTYDAKTAVADLR